MVIKDLQCIFSPGLEMVWDFLLEQRLNYAVLITGGK